MANPGAESINGSSKVAAASVPQLVGDPNNLLSSTNFALHHRGFQISSRTHIAAFPNRVAIDGRYLLQYGDASTVARYAL